MSLDIPLENYFTFRYVGFDWNFTLFDLQILHVPYFNGYCEHKSRQTTTAVVLQLWCKDYTGQNGPRAC